MLRHNIDDLSVIAEWLPSLNQQTSKDRNADYAALVCAWSNPRRAPARGPRNPR